MQVKKPAATADARLSVEEQKPPYQTTEAKTYPKLSETAVTPQIQPAKQDQAHPVTVIQATAPSVAETERKGSLLDQLRAERMQQRASKQEKVLRQPVPEEVKEYWDKYAGLLKEHQKHSAVTSFQLAQLSVDGDNIIVSCQSTLNQRFIENEITSLLQDLKMHFHNHNIQIVFNITESDQGPKQLEPKYLNSQERFRMMSEEYPLVKELKDRLKLDLKY
jgi:DNA polymerase-3 subunit gamma/tau